MIVFEYKPLLVSVCRAKVLECMLARERMRLHAVVPAFECVRTYTVLVDFNSLCVSSK